MIEADAPYYPLQRGKDNTISYRMKRFSDECFR